jgi:hypothetical protein
MRHHPRPSRGKLEAPSAAQEIALGLRQKLELLLDAGKPRVQCFDRCFISSCECSKGLRDSRDRLRHRYQVWILLFHLRTHTGQSLLEGDVFWRGKQRVGEDGAVREGAAEKKMES